RPDGARDEHERPEDQALVHGDVALEIGERVTLPEMHERLPGASGETGVCRERDRDVEVEDALREALVGVVRRDEEDERKSERHEHEGRRRQRRQRNAVLPGHRFHYSVTTYSKDAQQRTAKSTS